MDFATQPADGSARREKDKEDPEQRRTRFRFKSEHGRSKRSKRRCEEEPHQPTSSSSSSHHRSRDHRHRRRRECSRSRRSKDRRRGADASGEAAAETPSDAFVPEPMDPETAFRESLFDAMADDEGAAYWEGVYGQPIHTYPREQRGELEQMTDDEYAAYVRRKMWERTNAGLMEARARREGERGEKRRREEEADAVRAEVESSLRRGEARRVRRTWTVRWADYERAWQAWERVVGSEVHEEKNIPWPLGGLPRDEWTEDNLRTLLVHGLEVRGEKDFAARLKAERVRWHPDKMQQKLGGTVNSAVMKDITAVFQMMDKIWNETGQRAT